MGAFKIGINMAGAISAGAYTAGVLDFFTEALEEWYRAKARGDVVPAHDVSIEVLTGASAGGMCAAISTVMLQENFEHIHDTSRRDTTNRFYESWVNKIDISQLLKTDDLAKGPPVVSLLDSNIISEIASYALTPSDLLDQPRAYVSPNLSLFLSLTNLRGIPYSLNGAAPGSIEETTLFFGDRIRFETLRPDKTAAPAASAYTLDSSKPGADGGWDVLQTAAAATGAFPLFLAPRVLERKIREYTPPMWESVTSALTGTPPPIPPNFPEDQTDPMVTLNVDGGITNNDPFNYAHDYMTALRPLAPLTSGGGPLDADRAVLSIAPFPTTEKFDSAFAAGEQSGIFSVLPRLFSALISQSRFFGESLSQIMSGATFNRFVVAPSDPESETALQCATLGAFGGFFERGFRAHDYQLGRRNCQKFLKDFFVLPADNVIIGPALDSLPAEIRAQVIANFQRPAPGTYAGEPGPQEQQTSTSVWLPIIPLCSPSVTQEIAPVVRAKMTRKALDTVVSLILQRFRALMPIFLDEIGTAPLRWFLKLGQPFIRGLMRGPLRATLVKELGDSYLP